MERKTAGGEPIRVLVGIDADTDPRHPYFTVQVEGLGFGGADLETAAAVAPEIADLCTLHLADARTGEPMHAVANGWYAYSGGWREYEERERAAGRDYGYNREGLSDHERAARALRIDPGDLPEGLESREAFEAFAETLRPTWALRAEEARAQLAAMDSESGELITAEELLGGELDRLALSAHAAPLGVHEVDGWQHHAYRATLTHRRVALFTFTFRAGMALDEPSATDLVGAVLSDLGWDESEGGLSAATAAEVERQRRALVGAVGEEAVGRLVELAGQR